MDKQKVFAKADLQNGDVVFRRNGNVDIVMQALDMFITKSWYNSSLSTLNDDLTHKNYDGYDIVAVRRPTQAHDCRFDAFIYHRGELVYDRQRDTPVEMTMEEICAALGKTVKIIR